MPLNRITITLDEGDLLALQAIAVDADAAEALAFLQERILPQLPVRGTAACDSSRINPYLLPPVGGLFRKEQEPEGSSP